MAVSVIFDKSIFSGSDLLLRDYRDRFTYTLYSAVPQEDSTLSFPRKIGALIFCAPSDPLSSPNMRNSAVTLTHPVKYNSHVSNNYESVAVPSPILDSQYLSWSFAPCSNQHLSIPNAKSATYNDALVSLKQLHINAGVPAFVPLISSGSQTPTMSGTASPQPPPPPPPPPNESAHACVPVSQHENTGDSHQWRHQTSACLSSSSNDLQMAQESQFLSEGSTVSLMTSKSSRQVKCCDVGDWEIITDETKQCACRRWCSTVNTGGIFYVYGGSGSFGKHLQDLLRFDTSAGLWYELQPEGDQPAARYGASLSYYDGKLYMIGGCAKLGGKSCYVKDVYVYDIISNRWSQLRPTGCEHFVPRAYHSGVIWRNRLYVFGGEGKLEDRRLAELNDLWILQLDTCAWWCVTALPYGGMIVSPVAPEGLAPRASGSFSLSAANIFPRGRRHHSAVIWRDQMYILGGTPYEDPSKDFWKLHMATCSWSLVTPKGFRPAQRSDHSAAIISDLMIIHGGVNTKGTTLGDVHGFNLVTETWFTIETTGNIPLPRRNHSLFSISSEFSCYMFGGEQQPLNLVYKLRLLNKTAVSAPCMPYSMMELSERLSLDTFASAHPSSFYKAKLGVLNRISDHCNGKSGSLEQHEKSGPLQSGHNQGISTYRNVKGHLRTSLTEIAHQLESLHYHSQSLSTSIEHLTQTNSSITELNREDASRTLRCSFIDNQNLTLPASKNTNVECPLTSFCQKTASDLLVTSCPYSPTATHVSPCNGRPKISTKSMNISKKGNSNMSHAEQAVAVYEANHCRTSVAGQPQSIAEFSTLHKYESSTVVIPSQYAASVKAVSKTCTVDSPCSPFLYGSGTGFYQKHNDSFADIRYYSLPQDSSAGSWLPIATSEQAVDRSYSPNEARVVASTAECPLSSMSIAQHCGFGAMRLAQLEELGRHYDSASPKRLSRFCIADAEGCALQFEESQASTSCSFAEMQHLSREDSNDYDSAEYKDLNPFNLDLSFIE